MSINEEALTKALILLENDVDALGWDQPAIIYGIEGEDDDPILKKVAEVNGHPADTMEELYQSGMRPPDVCQGLALVTEAWRLISLQEAVDSGLVDLTDEREAHKDDWDEFFKFASQRWVEGIGAMTQISSLPDHMRVETRNIIAVLRDGSVFLVNHDRNGEIQSYKSDETAAASGRVPEAMFALLEPILQTSDEAVWQVCRKNPDGSAGEVLGTGLTESDAKKLLLSLPGHSRDLFLVVRGDHGHSRDLFTRGNHGS